MSKFPNDQKLFKFTVYGVIWCGQWKVLNLVKTDNLMTFHDHVSIYQSSLSKKYKNPIKFIDNKKLCHVETTEITSLFYR